MKELTAAEERALNDALAGIKWYRMFPDVQERLVDLLNYYWQNDESECLVWPTLPADNDELIEPTFSRVKIDDRYYLVALNGFAGGMTKDMQTTAGFHKAYNDFLIQRRPVVFPLNQTFHSP